jgi:RND family efflux transporter MFP subunit
MTPRLQLCLTPTLLVLAAALGACAKDAAARDEQRVADVPVRVRAAARVQRPATVDASGTIDANTTADVAFEVAGRVARVAADEGQPVRAGQTLAVIDPTDYRLSLDQAEASAAQATDEYTRMRLLHAKGSLADADYLKAEAAAKVSAAQAGLARSRLGHTRLESPIDGVVSRRGVDAGEMTAAGQPAFTIVAVDPVTVKIGVPEAQIGQVRQGAAATVSVPALGGERFAGRVTMIGVTADAASRTYQVKLDVPNPSHALRPGMIAEAHIGGARVVRALTVPGEVIVRDAEGATLVYVYAPKEKRVYGRRVTVGAPIDREVEIKDGLAPDDLVVVAGQQRLRDGLRVAATIDREGQTP